MCAGRTHNGRGGWRRRLFAWLHARGLPAKYAAFVAEHRERLLGGLRGTVLEIGPGTGENLKYYTGVRWVGLEPNVHMHPYLRERAAELGMEVDLRAGVAEKLPLDDASVDAVVSTMVLCSVDDVGRVLSEIRRVLRPGGQFVFIEHVAAPPHTPLRRTQGLIKAIWRFIGDNCHPDRDTGQAIRQAGFGLVDLLETRAPVALASPHVIGVATK